MTIPSADVLSKAVGCSPETAALWLIPLNNAARRFAVSTSARMEHFLPQLAYESARFARLEENLNYSAEGLLVVFPRYFPVPDLAKAYARQPEKIANRVYAGRMGNGDELSGQGYLFRGRGLIQLTGRDNYRRCGKELGLPLMEHPELLLVPVNAALSAAWF